MFVFVVFVFGFADCISMYIVLIRTFLLYTLFSVVASIEAMRQLPH